jgi:hypothetical protein
VEEALRARGGGVEEAVKAGGGGVEAALALSEPDLIFSTIGLIRSFSLPTKSKSGLITTSNDSCFTIVDCRDYFAYFTILLQIQIFVRVKMEYRKFHSQLSFTT